MIFIRSYMSMILILWGRYILSKLTVWHGYLEEVNSQSKKSSPKCHVRLSPSSFLKEYVNSVKFVHYATKYVMLDQIRCSLSFPCKRPMVHRILGSHLHSTMIRKDRPFPISSFRNTPKEDFVLIQIRLWILSECQVCYQKVLAT